MADPRYIRGETSPVTMPVLTAQALAIGDLLTLSSGNVIRAADVTWGTAVATPTAPTAADSAVTVGSPLTNALTGVKISYQFVWGEGALSAAATATPTAHASIVVSGASLTPAANAIHTNIYVESAAGSGTYLYYGRTYGESVLVNTYGAGLAPFAGNASGAAVLSDATTVTQYTFAKAFAGVAAQRKDATMVRIYGNSTDNIVRVSQGVWDYNCTSATFNVGDLVGPIKDTGSVLLSNTVGAVASLPLAVGRVVLAGSSLTTVRVQILSAMVPTSRA